MASPDIDADVVRSADREGVTRLLDPSFGFFVFAAHLLIVYIAAAVACVLGLGAASTGTRTAFTTALVVVTLAAAAVAWGHAIFRYRQQRQAAAQRFRLALTIGSDALASVAILFQLFALTLAPVCA